MMQKVLTVVKKYSIQIMLVLITIMLFGLSVQSAQVVSLDNVEDVEVYTKLIDRFATWIVLAGLIGVVSYIAITGGGKELDQYVAKQLKDFQSNDRFTQLERDYENLPDSAKQLFDAANAMLKMAASLLDLDSVDTLSEVIKDIADGPEESEELSK